MANNSGLQKSVANFLIKTFELYVALNCIITGSISKLFSENSKIQTYLKSKSVALLLNIAIFAFLSTVFGGVVGRIAFILVFLNVVAILINFVLKSDQE